MNIKKNDAEKQINNLFNLFKVGNYDLVITKGKKIIKTYPEYVILYNIIGSAYLNNGKFILAKEILKQIEMIKVSRYLLRQIKKRRIMKMI